MPKLKDFSATGPAHDLPALNLSLRATRLQIVARLLLQILYVFLPAGYTRATIGFCSPAAIVRQGRAASRPLIFLVGIVGIAPNRSEQGVLPHFPAQPGQCRIMLNNAGYSCHLRIAGQVHLSAACPARRGGGPTHAESGDPAYNCRLRASLPFSQPFPNYKFSLQPLTLPYPPHTPENFSGNPKTPSRRSWS
jgi:hypothetical protein